MSQDTSRRELLSVAVIAGASLAAPTLAIAATHPEKPKEKEQDEEIGPTEDLMREHGVLRRILLVYQEYGHRLAAGSPPPIDVLASSARLVQRFVEGYHEKLEEEEVFPRLEKAGKLADLTRILRAQHAAGRRVTQELLSHAKVQPKDARSGQAITTAIDQFMRMYHPHAAREDTELFPAFRSLFTEKELDKLGDQFEDKEHQLLGSGGFEGALAEVVQLEKAIGINDLAQFTPK